MRLLNIARDLLQALKGSSSIDVQEKVIELQAGILEMQERVADLRKENQVLREQLATAGSLCYRGNCYWRDNHPDPGPFCARCWDVERQLIHLNPTFDPRVLGCPRCRSAVDISGPADPAESPSNSVHH